MKILDLGCGGNKLKGAIGIDSDKNSHADIIHNLNKFPYPFPKNYFDIIYCSHILEHLDDVEKVMNEIYRIARPNGKIIIKVPHFSGRGAYNNMEHKHFFGCGVFEQFDKSKFKMEKIKLNYAFSNRKEKSVRLISNLLSFLANLNIWFCERIWCYWVGGFSEIYIELRVNK